ncbi:MAG: hypothetical protein JW852_06740, partial [Spirochaetales bacterium]|nr:hypothetical protein [Spirochaetales bacterium]
DGGRVTIDGENATENDRAQSRISCMTEKNVQPWLMKVKNGFRWACEFYPGKELGLDITPAGLQEVFVSLTNSRGDIIR